MMMLTSLLVISITVIFAPDKISLSHLFTEWGRLGHGASCWASMCIYTELGVSCETFTALVEELHGTMAQVTVTPDLFH